VSYQGFYINLDRSVARRTQIEGELARHGLGDRYQRFAAADGNVLNFPNPHLSPAEIGCFTSHYQLLRQNIASPTHLHILEDDAVLSPITARTIESAIANGTLDQYDVLFTETFLAPTNFEYRDALDLFDKAVDRDPSGKIVYIRPSIILHIASTSSYIVNRRAIPRLVEIIERALTSGAPVAIDIALRQAALSGMLATGCIFPFITSVRLDEAIDSTMPDRGQGTLTRIASTLGRTSFFVGADMAALNTLADRYLPVPENDPQRGLIGHVLAFSLTNTFRKY
jgi:GR25 family glycosyltransferase involved in LPS biosynthesis